MYVESNEDDIIAISAFYYIPGFVQLFFRLTSEILFLLESPNHPEEFDEDPFFNT